MHWFDIAVFVRFANSSIAIALGARPYGKWHQYMLPEWLSQAAYVSGVIDAERRIIMLVANIGQVNKYILC